MIKNDEVYKKTEIIKVEFKYKNSIYKDLNTIINKDKNLNISKINN